MIHRLRIGFDLDGVLYPFVSTVRAWLVGRGYPGAELGDVHRWAFYRDWGLTDAEWQAEFVEGIRAGVIFGPAPIAEDSLHTLKVLAQSGHEVHLITSRNVPGAAAEARRLTYQWVASTGFPFDSVTISHDKGCVDTDVFLEDSPDNCLMLAAESETIPVLLAQPYNAGERDGLAVVESVAEIAAVIDGLLHALEPDGSGGRCERCGDRWPAELIELGLLGTCQPEGDEELEGFVDLWPEDEGEEGEDPAFAE